MDDQISKKDLLEQTGISYGQLYRWKRMGLIPEEWFDRKSTFTGTETFFPRDRVLARIDKIKSMKGDDLSLEEIADVVAPPLGEVALSADDVADRRIASRTTLDLYVPERRREGAYVLGEVLTLYVLDGLLAEGTITADEARSLVATMEPGLAGEQGSELEALLLRKAGMSLWLLLPRDCRPRIEETARIVARVDLAAKLEGLRSLLQDEGKQR